ncbi:MAG: transcriptional regulator [Dokdonella sp.]|uniref:transcriptional regulator n=1 Tax=Dokdonella sp. TaxID=2291710 RepID=UPI003F7EECA5
MNLKTFIEDEGRRDSLLAALRCSPGYLWQIATQWRGRRPSAELARRIHDATGGEVSVHDLRPDIFGPTPAKHEQVA